MYEYSNLFQKYLNNDSDDIEVLKELLLECDEEDYTFDDEPEDDEINDIETLLKIDYTPIINLTAQWFKSGMDKFHNFPESDMFIIAMDDGCEYYYFDTYPLGERQEGMQRYLEIINDPAWDYSKEDPVNWDAHPHKLCNQESSELPIDLEKISPLFSYNVYLGVCVLGIFKAIKESNFSIGKDSIGDRKEIPLTIAFLDNYFYIATLTPDGWKIIDRS